MTTMSDDDAAARYRRVADTFGARAHEVDDWDAPAPCEGWVARDVVRHLVEWVPGLFGGMLGIPFEPVPSVDDDPVAAWDDLDRQLRALVDDPDAMAAEHETPMFGTLPLGVIVERLVTGDVLVHTWDLARAAGLDESIDTEIAGQMLAGMEPMDEQIRGEQFGPRVPVSDDADVVTRLIAFTGRQP